jgi:hypothetical protein
MSLSTATIAITGLSAEALRTIDQRATATGHSREEYVRNLLEEEHGPLDFSSEQLAVLRQEIQIGLDQLAQGKCRTYESADALMDDIEAETARQIALARNGTAA